MDSGSDDPTAPSPQTRTLALDQRDEAATMHSFPEENGEEGSPGGDDRAERLPPPPGPSSPTPPPSGPSSPNTRRAYAADWKHYSAWCRRHQLPALPPQADTIGRYVAALADGSSDNTSGRPASRATIERRLSALVWNCAQRGLVLDRYARPIATALADMRRRPPRLERPKQILQPADIAAMLETLDRATLRGLRDRAILLLGFAGGLRRSDIVGLDCGRDQSTDGSGWIEIDARGLRLMLAAREGWRETRIARGPVDQTCPVAAIETWLKFARITRGPLFRRVIGQGRTADVTRLNDRHIARLVKNTAQAAGIRSELSARERMQLFSSRSLRPRRPTYPPAASPLPAATPQHSAEPPAD